MNPGIRQPSALLLTGTGESYPWGGEWQHSGGQHGEQRAEQCIGQEKGIGVPLRVGRGVCGPPAPHCSRAWETPPPGSLASPRNQPLAHGVSVAGYSLGRGPAGASQDCGWSCRPHAGQETSSKELPMEPGQVTCSQPGDTQIRPPSWRSLEMHWLLGPGSQPCRPHGSPQGHEQLGEGQEHDGFPGALCSPLPAGPWQPRSEQEPETNHLPMAEMQLPGLGMNCWHQPRPGSHPQQARLPPTPGGWKTGAQIPLFAP